MLSWKTIALSGVIAALAVECATAGLTPQFTSFGPLPGATFGGSGIPNNAVAITTITNGNNTITLGLTAHQRYSNPAVTNDGAGTFIATPGSNYGDPSNPNTPSPSATEGATWNFAFYVDVSGTDTGSTYSFDLNYDFDPDPNAEDFGTIMLGSATPNTTIQDSQNLLFGYLDAGFPGLVVPPSGDFDPDASGVYGFQLLAYSGSGSSRTLLGESAVLVQVGELSAVPEPGTLAGGLLGVGVLLAGAWRRRRAGS